MSIQITLNAATTTDQVVTLSCDSPYFSVPDTVTVPAGSSVAYTYGIASPDAPMSEVEVDATANGYTASCGVGISQ